jgi:hypothetical protein
MDTLHKGDNYDHDDDDIVLALKWYERKHSKYIGFSVSPAEFW